MNIHVQSNWTVWREQLKALFEQPEEFDLAFCAYPYFEIAWSTGRTPQKAFNDFDKWAQP